jgi:hypothetical protein
MNFNEVITAFKEFLRSDPEYLTEEDHELFRASFCKAPKNVLTQVRILIEQMKPKIDPMMYQNYYHLINSLINSQGALQGRTSPDILEPVTDMSLINPIRNYSSNEVIEITTGTSIWALYLKRQLLEQSRIDQRHIKSAIQIKFFLLRVLIKLKNFAFLEIFHARTRTRVSCCFFMRLMKLFNDRIYFAFSAVKRINKRTEKIEGLFTRLFKILGRKEKIWQIRTLGKRFKTWKSKINFGFSYFSFSPIKGEKEIDFETEEKLMEANFILVEKSVVLSKNLMRNFEKIGKRIRAGVFLKILNTNQEKNKENFLKEAQEKFLKVKNLENLKKIMKKNHLVYLIWVWNKFKNTQKLVKIKEKCLKSLNKFLKFRFFTIFNKFKQVCQAKIIKSNDLERILRRLAYKQMRGHFLRIFNFHNFLMKKGFEAFIFNFYEKNAETVNRTWRWKISNSEAKWQKLIENNKKSARNSSSFLTFLEVYIKSLKIHAFNSLKKPKS